MYNPVTSKLPDKNAHFRAAMNSGKSVYDVDMLFGFPRKTLSGGSKFYNQASLVGGEDFYNNAALTGGAEFYNDAALRGGAEFYNDAALRGGAEFYNDAALRGGAEFYNDAALRGGAEFYNDAALRGGAEFYNDAALRGGSEFYNDAALKGGAEFYNNAALRGGFKLPAIFEHKNLTDERNGGVKFIKWGEEIGKAAPLGEELYRKILDDNNKLNEWSEYQGTPGTTLTYLFTPNKSKRVSIEDVKRALIMAMFCDALKAAIAINQYSLDQGFHFKPNGDVERADYTAEEKWRIKNYLVALKYNLANLMGYIKEETDLEFLVQRCLKVMRGPYKQRSTPPTGREIRELANQDLKYYDNLSRYALRYLYRGISPFKLYVGKEEPGSKKNKKPRFRPLTTLAYRQQRYGEDFAPPGDILPDDPFAPTFRVEFARVPPPLQPSRQRAPSPPRPPSRPPSPQLAAVPSVPPALAALAQLAAEQDEEEAPPPPPPRNPSSTRGRQGGRNSSGSSSSSQGQQRAGKQKKGGISRKRLGKFLDEVSNLHL